jgi:hypothetical protein
LSVKDLALLQAARLIADSLNATDLAVVVSTSGEIYSGFTSDHAKLHDSIVQLRRHALNESVGGECPDISYYQADLIQNKNDAAALATATQDAIAALDQQRRSWSLDPRLAECSCWARRAGALRSHS